MADRVGQQLGNYRLLRLLGSGGFADVYLGEHIYLKRQVALKILHQHLVQGESAGFLQEAQTIARLDHPNIIQISDFGIDGTPFLVMEYLPLGSLRERHPAGTPLPLPTIVSYLKQMADALQYAHDAKVIHRDVKPANMLMRSNEQIVLSDFGIATAAHRTLSLQTLNVSGSPHYIAPEQVAGKPRPASDQYSLGMVVYEWLCGKPAFQGEVLAVMYQQTYAPVPSLREQVPTIAPELERVVLKALTKDPQQRFESVRAFAQAVLAAVEPARTLEPTLPVLYPDQPLEPTLLAAIQPAQPQPPSLVSAKTKEQWLKEGNAHYDQGRYEDAIESYTQALQLDPKYASAYSNRGTAYDVLKQYDQALADYTQAIQLDPKDADTYINRGNTYEALGQSEQALADYTQAIQLDPKDAVAYYNRGLAHYDLKQYEQALADYTQAIQLNPKYTTAYYNRGTAHYDFKQYEQALADYTQAIQLNPKDADAYYNRGNAYYALKQYKQALADYDRALELDPNHANAQKWRQEAYRMLHPGK